MRFDSNQAWKEAAAAVSANRDLLLALAGVFLVVPSLALTVFMPPPEPPKGATFDATMALLGQYYTQAWPALLLMVVASMIGSLAMLALFTDRSRPTVSQAIRQALSSLPVLLLAQVGTAVTAALLLAPLLGLGKATGSPAVTLLAMLAAAGVLAVASIRLSLVSPVIMVEGVRNPLGALRRSWDITRGNGWRLAAFYVLLLIAFLIATKLIGMVIGLVVALVTSGETARTIGALVDSSLSGVVAVYFIAVTAACHRQLIGSPGGSVGGTAE